MEIQKRLIVFITRANWILLALIGIGGFLLLPGDYALGIIAGGLIVTVNFHMLAKTLRKSLAPPYLASHHTVIAKYYIRFIISSIIIFFLIRQQWVDPLGLFIGLSVVVASITLATLMEITRVIRKEAV